jgi:homocitrate synthase NifV
VKYFQVVDTTLRDGEQAAGLAFSLAQKLNLAMTLAEAGVRYLEAGIPAMGGSEAQAVSAIARELPDLHIIAWNRLKTSDIDASLACGVKELHLSFPVSRVLLNLKFPGGLPQALHALDLCVDRIQRAGAVFSVGAEDAFRGDREILTTLVGACQRHGAIRLRLCDTVGSAHPGSVARLVRALRHLGAPPLEIHAHNDLGLATANTLAALHAGAGYADVTVLGIGERAGNAALEEVALAAKLLLNRDCRLDASQFLVLSRLTAQACGEDIPVRKPVCGSAVFRHEAGIHVSALMKDSRAYEFLEPGQVGAVRTFVLGKHSGRAPLERALGESAALSPTRLLAQVRERAITGGGALGADDLEALTTFPSESILTAPASTDPTAKKAADTMASNQPRVGARASGVGKEVLEWEF